MEHLTCLTCQVSGCRLPTEFTCFCEVTPIEPRGIDYSRQWFCTDHFHRFYQNVKNKPPVVLEGAYDTLPQQYEHVFKPA